MVPESTGQRKETGEEAGRTEPQRKRTTSCLTSHPESTANAAPTEPTNGKECGFGTSTTYVTW